MKALACEFTSVYAKLYKKAGLQIKLLSASSQISSSDAFMFFPSSVADVALRLGPYMSISRKHICTRASQAH